MLVELIIHTHRRRQYILGLHFFTRLFSLLHIVHNSLNTEAVLYLRMQLLRWWETCSGMINSDLNGMICLQTRQPLKSVLLQEPWKCNGFGRYKISWLINSKCNHCCWCIWFDVLMAAYCLYSFPSSVKTENILLVEEYGNVGGHTIVWQRYETKVCFFCWNI